MSLSSSAVYPDGASLGVADVVGPDLPDDRTPVEIRTMATITARIAPTPRAMSHGGRLPLLDGDPGDPAPGCGPVHGDCVETYCGPLPYTPSDHPDIGVTPAALSGGWYGWVGGVAAVPVGRSASALCPVCGTTRRLSLGSRASRAPTANAPVVAYRCSGCLAMP